MIYTLFIYQSNSGILLYDINFQDLDTEKVAMFSSFFTAIKSFTSQLVLKGSKSLKNIELGDYTIFISSEPKINIDLVIIADKIDEKIISGLLPKFIEVIYKHKEIFFNYKGEMAPFRVLDEPISELITARHSENDTTQVKGKSKDFLNAIYAKENEKGQEEFHLTHDRLLLISDYNKKKNIVKKITIGKKIIELSNKLNDEVARIEYKDKVNELSSVLENAKIKLKYYLEKTKDSLLETKNALVNRPLKQGNFRASYMNLYSFSTKLKEITGSKSYLKYKELASSLIEKENISEAEFAKIFDTIQNLSSNIEDYLD